MKKNYKLTQFACFAGIMNQAICTNVTAILFVPLAGLYNLSIWQLGLLAGINFASQLIADVILTFIMDKFSFRPLVLTAVVLSGIGYILFASVPYVLSVSAVYIGFVIATVIFSFASGMLEVLISPITESMPGPAEKKGPMMALIHSFYAWGQVIVILVTSLFLITFGYEKWNIIMYIWVVASLAAVLLFSIAPLEKKQPQDKKKSGVFFSPFFIVACLAIMMGGTTEVIINQYVSAFAELSLGLSKITGDLVGMGLFAVLLGVGRLLYGIKGEKVNMSKVLVVCSAAAAALFLIAGLVPVKAVSLTACILCGLAVSLLWPGTLVVTSARFPSAGLWIFAVLAICGDFGASAGPMAAGFIAESAGLNYALAMCAVLPLIACVCHIILGRSAKKAAPDASGKMLG